MPESNPGLMTIFTEALERTDPAERAAYLDRACGGDGALRKRVEELLAAHPGIGRFLEPGAAGSPDATSPRPGGATGTFTPEAPRPAEAATRDFRPDGATGTFGAAAHPVGAAGGAELGTVVAGRYALVELLGEGGMGSVYRAEQTEPVKRAVAVKLIKSGMDSRAVLARFDAERQALALMDHPNIARVFDGGTTDRGQPFFVMELVRGVPLTDYCDSKRLSVGARLQLFVQVCQAVQHAHQKGVIHRDLKPGNVLVMEVDGRPTPKVIDFGVAKATEQRLTDMSFADTGVIVGTPEYMSPEQADPSSMDIDTRTDVYALGVILYELLTGSPPIDARQFKRGAVLEMLRMVREVEPPRPSTKLNTAENLPNVAANRGVEPARLAKALRGELDWVVMKALEKDRTRRYESANAFAADVQRYLADEVVEARPPSAGYRLKKFVRRHKGQVLAASLVLLALLSGIVGTTWGLIIARDETAEKEKARADEAARVKERDNANDELKYRLGVSDMVLAAAAYDKHDVVLAAERLEKVPPEQRGWEWRYLKQQTRGGLFTLRGHSGHVLGIAFSPNGERIVTGAWRVGNPPEVKLWDARTGSAVLVLNDLPVPEDDRWESQVFSLGGTRLATTGRDNTSRVWDARTGKLQWELKHASPVARVWLSPDGSRVATACLDGMVKVWNTETGKPQWEFKGKGKWTSAAFSPDGTRIFIGFLEDQTAKLWDTQTGKSLLDLTGFNDNRGLAFSPDGKRIASGGNSVKVWDAEKGGSPLLDLRGLMDVAGNTTFSPDGTRILIGGLDGTAKVLDAKTGTTLFTLKTPQESAPGVSWLSGWGEGEQSAAFSPDGTRIITVGGARGAHVAKVWDARTGVELLALAGHTDLVFCAAFSPDGEHILTGSLDGTAKVWDARTGGPRLEMGEPGRHMHSVAVSPDGLRIASGGGGWGQPAQATVWDARTGATLLELKGVKGMVKSVAFSRDGARIVTGASIFSPGHPPKGQAIVWDARTGAALLELKRPEVGGDIKKWGPAAADAGPPVLPRPVGVNIKGSGPAEGVNSVAFSPDGDRIVTAGIMGMGGGRELWVWDAHTGAVLFDLTKPGMPAPFPVGATPRGGCVAFSSDGTLFVAGGLKVIRGGPTEATVWDAGSGKVLLELHGRNTAQCVAFSRDGTRIVTGGGDDPVSNRTARLWEVPSARPEGFAAVGTQPLFELKGHTSPVACVAFSPDGHRIVTGSDDRTVRVWDAKTGTSLLELRGFRDRLMSVAFTPDGTRLVTGDFSGTVTVWDSRVGKDAPDEEELAYRRLQTQPNLRCYRASYDAARAAKDDFVGRFYLNLLPPPEQKVLTAQAAAEREIVAGRTQDALAHIATVSAARPEDWELALKLAALRAWFGRDQELADMCGRALESAKVTSDPAAEHAVALICCLRSTPDKARQEAALALARKALERDKDDPFCRLTLGIAAYRNCHFAEAEAALVAAAKGDEMNAVLTGQVSFFRAMILFRQGKPDEARRLAFEAAKTVGLPNDEKNPLLPPPRGETNPLTGPLTDILILWLAHREAKALIGFDPIPSAPPPREKK